MVLTIKRASPSSFSLNANLGGVCCFALLLCCFSQLCSALPWDANNNPFTRWGGSLVQNFNALPQGGSALVSPWSETYWPNYKGGISWRWSDPAFTNAFQYPTYSKQQLLTMSAADLGKLSPSEKWDIFTGDYGYGLTRGEWARTSPSDATWEGMCEGWAQASIQYTEPRPVSLPNQDGIVIPFGASDVKALLVYYTAIYASQRALYQTFVGSRCDLDLAGGAVSTPACSDVNAGTFHIIIANMLGLQRKSFVGDVDRGYQVWNQPIVSYTTQVLSSNLAPHAEASSAAVTEVLVQTTMIYGNEYGPSWAATGSHTAQKVYQYYLELDAQGNIVGGSWNQFDRLDFQWSGQAAPFYGQFASLATLYSASVGQAAGASADSPNYQWNAPLVINSLLTSPNDTIVYEVQPNVTMYNWLISVEGASAIDIQIVDINTARNRNTLKVYDGSTDSAILLGVYSGNMTTITKPELITSGSEALLVFTSDGTVSEGEGFTFSYVAVMP